MMCIAEIVDPVRQVGYGSKPKDFHQPVSLRLFQFGHVFKEVSRGRYTAK